MSKGKRRIIIDATKALVIRILARHIALAKSCRTTDRCKIPGNCVVAQAIADAFGDLGLEGFQVGSTITKIYINGKCIRYATPSSLKRAIPVFDATGEWQLPEGEYTLLPPPKSARLGARPNRWNRESVKKTTPGQDMFGGRRMPLRQVLRADSFQSPII